MYEVDVRFIFDKDNKMSEFEAGKFIADITREIYENNSDKIAIAYVHNDMEKI